MSQKPHGGHESQEGQKIGSELRHGNFHGAHNEMMKELHSHPHEFGKLLKSINHDLKQHHQSPLSIEHDHGKHISHIHFGKHDIYDGHNSKQHQKPHGEPKNEKNPESARKRTDHGQGDKPQTPEVEHEHVGYKQQMERENAAKAKAAQDAQAAKAAQDAQAARTARTPKDEPTMPPPRQMFSA